MKLTNLYESTGKSVKDLKGYPFEDQYADNLCINNENLVTLEGSPSHVSGLFDCSMNLLSDLSFGPKTAFNFYAHNNMLTSLKGAPTTVTGIFTCYGNKLSSLIGLPKTLGGLDAGSNFLTSLEGLPKYMGRDLYCNDNILTSLEYARVEIGYTFNCSGNELTSLKYSPTKVGFGNFDCHRNNITSLEYLRVTIEGSFDCAHNKITSLIGVDDAIKKLYGNFACYNNPICEGGLGLLLIDGIAQILSEKPALQIINKYVQEPERIYDCQAELIEKGYEDFAQL